MGIRKYKPTTNGRRGMSTLTNDEITTSRPEKSLLKTISKTGRNNQGRMTVQHIGGGAKRKYRIIDFKRNKFNVTGKVFTDKPIKKSSQDKLLKIPTINSSTYLIGNFPNCRLQLISLLDTSHIYSN